MVPREYSQVSLQFPARGGVSPLHPVRSTAKKLNLTTALREHEKKPSLAPLLHISAADSPRFRRASFSGTAYTQGAHERKGIRETCWIIIRFT
jgi:hypothetical protein